MSAVPPRCRCGFRARDPLLRRSARLHGGAGGLLAPLLGALGDHYGCWRVLISAAALSVLLWPLPALMTTLWSFGVAWAILNGLTTGVFALSFTVLADAIVPAMRGRIMCFAYLPLLFANMLGPGLGALITQQTLFAIFPVAAALTALGGGLWGGRRCKNDAGQRRSFLMCTISCVHDKE